MSRCSIVYNLYTMNEGEKWRLLFHDVMDEAPGGQLA